MTLPGISIKETVEAVRNEGYEGRNILVIGNAGFKEDILKLYTLYNYEDTIKKLKSQDTETKIEGPNKLKIILQDIFNESKVTGPNDTYGLNKVYAINIGPDPTIETLIEALKLSETIYDAEIEVYPGLSDIPALNLINGHLKKLEGFGDYRIALATTPPDAKVEDMVKITSQEEEYYISSGRIALHVNPDIVGAFAAKVACTPYFMDPAYKPYKTITPNNIKKYRRDELETLVNAGLVVDWIRVDPTSETKIVEPVYAPATNYTPENTPADAYLHQRLNADHQSEITDKIAQKYIKQNKTETARQAIEHSCTSYLEQEVKESKLNGFAYEIYPNHTDPYSLIVKMSLIPVKSIHTIEINRIIQG